MYVLSVQYSSSVVSVFLFGGKANLVLLTLFYSTLLALMDGRTDGHTDRQTESQINPGCAGRTLTGSSRLNMCLYVSPCVQPPANNVGGVIY